MKKTTAYIATGVAAAAGVSAIIGNFVGIDPSQVFSSTSSGLGQFGSFLKTTGILGLVGALVFLLVKFNICKVMMIQEGETGLLIRRGKVVFDKKKGLPYIVNPDRYQVHVAIFRHIAIVNNRERMVELGSLPFTVGGETWVAPLTVKWSILGDAESMHNALIKVSDGNRFDEKFGALERMVEKQCITGLNPAFKEARLSESGGPPIVDFRLVDDELEKRVNEYGCHYYEVLEAPMHRYVGPYDGMKAIADAIKQSPEALRNHLSAVHSAS